MDFIKDYKFVISFENSTHPGYTNEKLIEPMLVNSIPIYWGNIEVGKDFNSRSFIHVNEYVTYKEVIHKMIELDKGDEQYQQLAIQPWFNNNRLPEEFSDESFVTFFDFITSNMKIKKPLVASLGKSNLNKMQLFKNIIETAVYHRLGIQKGFR